jgi:hypothetical protein
MRTGQVVGLYIESGICSIHSIRKRLASSKKLMVISPFRSVEHFDSVGRHSTRNLPYPPMPLLPLLPLLLLFLHPLFLSFHFASTFGKEAVWTLEDPAGMVDVEEDEAEKHGDAVEAVKEGFVSS